MADFSALIQRIKDAVYENGVQAITGQILQDCLKDVVNTVNVAKQDGIYRVTVTVDNNTGVPSATARMDDDTYTLEFSFHNLKGETGPQGPQGDTPVLTADSDGVIYSDGVMLTRVIKDTTDALTTRADSDHARADSDHARAETDHTDITRARGDAETAASEANYASLRANTAADNADAAREAIQSDLAQKQDVIPDLQQIRAGATDTVKYSTQSLTDAQKEQARTNIGAASDSEVSQLRSEVNEIYGTTEIADKYVFGGTSNVITFDALSLAEDGDAIEFKVKCNPSVSGSFAFARNGNNIAISLSNGVLGIKSAANEWQTGFNASSGSYNFGGTAGAIDSNPKTFLLIREGASLKLYIDGTFYKELENAPTITFDRLGGVHNGNYWSGELDFFRYIHNGVTTELLDFPGYSATGDVTVTTHDVKSGLLTEKVDKVPGKELSTNDFTDADKAMLDNVAEAEALKMTGDFIELLEEQSLNDSGSTLSLPIIKRTGFARFVGVTGKIYTNAANLVKLLLKPGTITYNGVTLTIDENFWVTITGTASATGYICYNDLKGYAGLDIAKAAVTIPEMPSGTYRLGMTQRDSATTKGSIYVRAKNSASFLATLTSQGTTNATIDMSEVGAMGAYIISGTTYNEKFRFMVMPSIVFNSLAGALVEYNSTNFPTNIGTIEADGIFKYENYTIGDGTATSIEKMLPVENYATKGVTCLWFGDSISELRNLPHLVGEKLAVNVIDVSEAGSPFTKTGLSKWYDTGVESLIEQKIADDFSLAETALSEQLADGNITQDRYTAKMANLESLENCDMSSIKKIVILAGTNDLSSSALTLADFKTGIADTLTNIFTEYPEIQVYCITPPYRTDADDVRPSGLVLSDIVDAIVEVCKSFGVPCLDFLANCGVNSVNSSHWIPDGLHPSAAGDEMFSTRLANWLNSSF